MKLSKKIPDKRTTDYRGTPIVPGWKVAFNRSGYVVLGKIVKLQRSEWKDQRPGLDGNYWWRLMFELIVEDEEGKQSTIKNPGSFVIVEYI